MMQQVASLKADKSIEKLAEIEPEFSIASQGPLYEKFFTSSGDQELLIKSMGFDTQNYQSMLFAGVQFMKMKLLNTPSTVEDYVERLKSRLSKETMVYMLRHKEKIQKELDDTDYMNYNFDYFSASVIVKSYLLRDHYGGDLQERPTFMHMRIAIQLYMTQSEDQMEQEKSIKNVFSAYFNYCRQFYVAASPTMFNAGTVRPQMASCFCISIGDSLHHILKSVYNAGMISSTTGACGIDFTRLRHSEISNTGMSTGVVPVMKIFNDIARYVDQGGGKRKGATTAFLEPWHIDTRKFVEIVDQIGDHNERTHDISTALWTPWLFWERVYTGGKWTLFDPKKYPQLLDVHGNEFARRYVEAENDGETNEMYKFTMDAGDLLDKICQMSLMTGKPYIMHGDTCNACSAHRHIGYIRQSNLCLEIIEYTDDETINICILMSINISKISKSSGFHEDGYPKGMWFDKVKSVKDALSRIDWDHLGSLVRSAIRNLNRMIDTNFYPLDIYDLEGNRVKDETIRKTSQRFRSVGLGIQGLAELFHHINVTYESEEAGVIDETITACIYWNALLESMNLAVKEGKHDVWEGSSYQKGKLHFDLGRESYREHWGSKVGTPYENRVWRESDYDPLDPSLWGASSIVVTLPDGTMDVSEPTWDGMRKMVSKHGLRNSLLLAQMPTASSAKIGRNSESTELRYTNIYSAETISGNYPEVNRYMYYDLKKMGIWTEDLWEFLVSNDGRILGLTEWVSENALEYIISGSVTFDDLRYIEQKYKCMFEVPQKLVLYRAAKRQKYIDQSQSTSNFMLNPTIEKLKATLLYTNKLCLKTGMYYNRTEFSEGKTCKFTTTKRATNDLKKINCSGDACISCQ